MPPVGPRYSACAHLAGGPVFASRDMKRTQGASTGRCSVSSLARSFERREKILRRLGESAVLRYPADCKDRRSTRFQPMGFRNNSRCNERVKDTGWTGRPPLQNQGEISNLQGSGTLRPSSSRAFPAVPTRCLGQSAKSAKPARWSATTPLPALRRRGPLSDRDRPIDGHDRVREFRRDDTAAHQLLETGHGIS
jgi:hypothetical protein